MTAEGDECDFPNEDVNSSDEENSHEVTFNSSQASANNKATISHPNSPNSPSNNKSVVDGPEQPQSDEETISQDKRNDLDTSQSAVIPNDHNSLCEQERMQQINDTVAQTMQQLMSQGRL